MKVSDANTNNAAAVLGYQNAVAMTMDDSPEFIAIFQKNLYQHHTLAFVRETLTNAWDAHIDANLTDTPIEVSLSADHGFSIKDKGHGIAPEMMQQVYGIIGRGTKTGDNRSTGGFGLGCKSPHGYVDAFQVVSCHKGTKTIYQIVKASELTNGKPAIITIMSMPTDETGLTVTIPVQYNDLSTLDKYITNIVYSGDFPCMYTYEDTSARLLPTMQLKNEPSSYIVLVDSAVQVKLPVISTSGLHIRYANIVYPLPLPTEEHEAYAEAYGMLKNWLVQLKHFTSYSHPQVIIQAEAGTLSVQPSRESLSASTATLNKLCELINNMFIQYNHALQNDYPVHRKAFLEAYKTATELRTNSYVGTVHNVTVPLLPMIDTVASIDIDKPHWDRRLLSDVYRNTDDLVKHIAICKSLSSAEETEIFDHYNRACEKAGLFPSGWVDKVIALSEHYSYGKREYVKGTAFLHKAFNKLDLNALCSYPNAKITALCRNESLRYYSAWEYTELETLSVRQAMAFGSRKVVLTCNMRQTESRLQGYLTHDKISTWESLLIVYVTRGKTMLPEIKQQIIDSGYQLIDLTVWEPWEDRPVAAAKPRASVTMSDLATKGTAYPLNLFSSHLKKGNNFLTVAASKYLIASTPHTMLTHPEYVLLFARSGEDTKCYDRSIPPMFISLLTTILGDKIGVVFTKRDYKALSSINTPFKLIELLLDYLEAKWAELKPVSDAYAASKLPSKASMCEAGVKAYTHDSHNILGMLYANPVMHSSLPFKIAPKVDGTEVDEFRSLLAKFETYFRVLPANTPAYHSLVTPALCARYKKLRLKASEVSPKPSSALVKFATQLAKVSDCFILSQYSIHDETILNAIDIEMFKYLIKLIRKQPYDKPTS